MERKTTMFRKALAGILGVAVFAGSVFTGTAFAATTDQDHPTQIVSQGTAVTEQTDNVTVKKTVTETGVENQFNITLTVTTQERLQEIPATTDSAVVLVMDTSGSMGGDRLTAAKKAAKDFVDKYVKDSKTTDKRYAALVGFDDDAITVRGWTNLTEGTSDFKKFIDKLAVKVKQTLLGYTYTGGTNMEGGLQLAYNLIDSGKTGVLKDCKNINIVLLSDGCPTYHVDESTRSSTTKVKGVEGGGNRAEKEDWQPVETIAGKIRANKINLYSVAYSTGYEDFKKDYFKETRAEHREDRPFGEWYDCTEDIHPDHWKTVNGVKKHGYWDTRWESVKVSDWMNSFSDKCFSAGKIDDLSVKFENIAKLIKLGAQAWKVTDPMGQFINYGGAANSSASEDNKYSFANGILTWDLKNSVPTEDKSGDVTTYTYTLTYPITLNTAGAGFDVDKAYATNGTTTLYYYLFSKVDDSTNVPETPKTLDFNVPTVKGFLGTLSFQKVDQDGNALPDASFAVSGTSLTGVSDASGNVTIAGIPSGFTYTLTETKMDGYTALEPIPFQVSYGEVSKADGTSLATVINTKEENDKYVVIKHEYYNADGYLYARITDDFSHMGYKEGFVPERIYDYGDMTFEAWGDATAKWVYNATDENLGTHDDYVITLKYKQKSEVEEVKDYTVVIHKYFDADGNLVAEVKDTAFDHMLYKEGFEPVPETTYDGVEYVVREIKEGRVNLTKDTVIGVTHNDHVFTIEYQVKKGAEEVKDYVVIIHKYFDVDGNLVAEVRDTDFDHMLYKEGFQPVPETTYDGVEYVVRGIDEGWVNHTTDNAVSEVHNEHWYTIEYQVEDDGPRYLKIRVNHEYYTDGNLDGTEIEEFDYSEDFAPTQQLEYSEKTYTYVSTTGPKDIGDGYLEYTLVYRRTTETPPTPVVNDTVIVIEKSWDGAVYDGDIPFTVTNERNGRTYTGTLRAGRTTVRIVVPYGGTYTVSENVPDRYEVSFPEGDSVKVSTGSSATVKVENTEVKVTPPPVEPTPTPTPTPGEETTIVTPPKTGSAAGGLSVLFGLAAAAVVGSAVLRRKKK